MRFKERAKKMCKNFHRHLQIQVDRWMTCLIIERNCQIYAGQMYNNLKTAGQLYDNLETAGQLYDNLKTTGQLYNNLKTGVWIVA